MTDLATLHRRAAEDFATILRNVSDGQWADRTPCTDWDVRALVAHNVDECLWVPPLVDGLTVDEVGDRFAGDVLGDDPAAAYLSAAEESCVAFEQDGVLDRVVHLSFGDVPCSEFASQRLADLVVHGWDLARAIGAAEDLDAEQVEYCYGYAKPHEALFAAASEWFDPPIQPDPGDDTQTRLLKLFGRRL